MEKIEFQISAGETAYFYVLETTRLGGTDYILVTEEEEGDSEALILKDVSAPEDTQAVYEIVSDDDELYAVAQVFENILEDVELT